MRLGVDFGTTRTTVAIADRGNYPLVAFPDSDGDSFEYIPSIAAVADKGVVYGFEAQRLANEGADHARSFKRLLAYPDVTTESTTLIGDHEIKVLDLITGFLFHVAAAVRKATGITREPLDVVVGIPAHAHSGQRFLTLEAFRRAGFKVITMINEPSAAGFEYAHRHSSMLNSKRTKVLVYDLGGGTFDASLVSADGKHHEVLASNGNNLLGGDDFDQALAEIAATSAGTSLAALDAHVRADVLDSARAAKESLHPQSRFMTVAIEDSTVSIPVADYYDAVAPLVDETIRSMNPLLVRADEGDLKPGDDVAGIYVVGGGSELPLISRLLRDQFGRRVRRSSYSAGSTAIGLAIAADPSAGYSLTETLSRGLGVFREMEEGALVSFDPILTPDIRFSPEEGAEVIRRYVPAHNVGCYRYAEYTSLDDDGVPRGAVFPLEEIVFPFDPALRGNADLSEVAIERTPSDHEVEERYTVDGNGIVSVTIRDLTDGYAVTHSLGTAH